MMHLYVYICNAYKHIIILQNNIISIIRYISYNMIEVMYIYDVYNYNT